MPRKLSAAEQEQQDIQAGKYRDKKYDLPNLDRLDQPPPDKQAGKYKLPETKYSEAGYKLMTPADMLLQQRVVDVSGRPIAEKLHTFANEIASEILEAERAKEELGSIRATLLVNFMQQNHFGFTIKDEGTTMQMLVKVLEQFTNKEWPKKLTNAGNAK